jgi:hypothetical protein
MPADATHRTTAVRLLTAFVVGFVTLTLEIAYTRVISFKLFYYYTYFVIGLALLGLGAASAVTALSRRLRGQDTTTLVQRVAPPAAAAGLVGYAVVALLPTDTNQLWVGSWPEALGQLLRLLVLSLSLTAVFFAAGLLLAALVVAEVRAVRRLYFWDLVGAALGCLLAVPLQATIGPPAMIAGALAVLAGLGLVAAVVTRRHVAVTGAAVIVVVAGAVLASGIEVRTDASKTLRVGDEVVAGDWGAVFRVDAVAGLGPQYLLHHDGLWGSAIWEYDGSWITTAQYASDGRQIPFAAYGEGDGEGDGDGDAGPRVLIIGAAGGHEIQAALTYGAAHVDAVELNPVTVDLLRGRFAEYAGNITSDPRVNYVQGDGRTYLARSDDTYDIVWFVAPDSYAATNAATAGAFVLSESYLYTTEMIELAADHLTDDGVMVAQFGDFEFDERPTRTARYLVTAREALDLGDSFADHVALVVERSDLAIGRISTIMLFRPPVPPGAGERIHEAAARVPGAEVRFVPDKTRADGLTSDLIDGTDGEVAAIVDGYEYDISAIDDDRPFFWHFTPFSSVLGDWSRGFENSEIAIGERLLLLLVAISAVVAGVLLWLPFAVTRGRATGPVPGRRRLFTYFAALGLGFMLIEIAMIQRFALLLGFPTLALSVSLCTLLVSTAIGARCSAVVRRVPGGLLAVTAMLIGVCALYLVISDPVTDAALAWPQPARIALVAALLAPIGLLLGTFLPTGMDLAVDVSAASGTEQGRLVAWCWAVNGFFSVLGSSLTTIVTMTFGFDRAVAAGLAVYLVAALVGRRATSAVAPATS